MSVTERQAMNTHLTAKRIYTQVGAGQRNELVATVLQLDGFRWLMLCFTAIYRVWAFLRTHLKCAANSWRLQAAQEAYNRGQVALSKELQASLPYFVLVCLSHTCWTGSRLFVRAAELLTVQPALEYAVLSQPCKRTVFLRM